MDHDMGLCSGCGSMLRWVFVGCAPAVGFYWLWWSDLWVWPCSMASPLVWPWVVGVTDCDAIEHSRLICGAGLAVLWVAVW